MYKFYTVLIICNYDIDMFQQFTTQLKDSNSVWVTRQYNSTILKL